MIMDYDVLGPFMVATMVSLGAVCIFVWAVLSGAFYGADDASINFFRTEQENDRTNARTDA
jgi:hypothetical protein